VTLISLLVGGAFVFAAFWISANFFSRSMMAIQRQKGENAALCGMDQALSWLNSAEATAQLPNFYPTSVTLQASSLNSSFGTELGKLALHENSDVSISGSDALKGFHVKYVIYSTNYTIDTSTVSCDPSLWPNVWPGPLPPRIVKLPTSGGSTSSGDLPDSQSGSLGSNNTTVALSGGTSISNGGSSADVAVRCVLIRSVAATDAPAPGGAGIYRAEMESLVLLP
jgi:hypothetical protein